MKTSFPVSKRWPAPAKLNLFLHVTGQREDGYHELQTLFQFIDRCDYLDFQITETAEIQLHSNMSDSVPDSDNLILKAAKSLKRYTQFPGGADIWLDKLLPMGGGLGGGFAVHLDAFGGFRNRVSKLNQPCHNARMIYRIAEIFA